jgi:hypothetical protein
MMMQCKQATELISQSQDRNLTFSERLQLKFHLLICNGCARCNKQMKLMHEAVKQLKDR